MKPTCRVQRNASAWSVIIGFPGCRVRSDGRGATWCRNVPGFTGDCRRHYRIIIEATIAITHVLRFKRSLPVDAFHAARVLGSFPKLRLDQDLACWRVEPGDQFFNGWKFFLRSQHDQLARTRVAHHLSTV